MKVAVDCLFLGDGCDSRAEAYAVAAARRLAKRAPSGFEAVVYAGSAVSEHLGIPVRSPSRIFPGGARMWEEWRLPDLAYADKADILLCPCCPMPRRSLIPAVVAVADALPLLRDEANASPWHKTLRRRLPLSLARAALVVAPSAEVRDDLLEWNGEVDETRAPCSLRLRRLKRRMGVPEDGRRPIHGLAEKIRVIPWGAEPAFQPASDDPAGARDTPHPAYVLLPVREGETRRAELAMKAWFAATGRNRLPHRLLLLAQPPGKSRMNRMLDFAANLGVREKVTVVRPESLDEAAALFRHAAVTVLPYERGDCGLSLFRSVACGTPVIASGCASLARLCRPAPDSLAIIEDSDVAAWRLAMEKVLLRPAGNRARPTGGIQVPDWDRHVEELLAECGCVIDASGNEIKG